MRERRLARAADAGRRRQLCPAAGAPHAPAQALDPSSKQWGWHGRPRQLHSPHAALAARRGSACQAGLCSHSCYGSWAGARGSSGWRWHGWPPNPRLRQRQRRRGPHGCVACLPAAQPSLILILFYHLPCLLARHCGCCPLRLPHLGPSKNSRPSAGARQPHSGAVKMRSFLLGCVTAT